MPLNILIIDDDPHLLRLMTLILKQGKHKVRTATNVPDAWKLLNEETPDIICCDLMMPDVNGLDFLLQRQKHPTIANVPVIVISGIGEKSWFEEAERLGAFSCLSKPFSAHKLMSEIDAAMMTVPKQVTSTTAVSLSA
ncbi:MAG: response regulator [Chloroflexi bacterium]|nr:MAG: response regulator [Chloroflexota bacterium]